jgi:IAA-amino acid hydrolase
MADAGTGISGVLVLLVLLCCSFGHQVQASQIDVAPLLEKARSDGDFVEWMQSVRRELHRKPELMYKEFETSKVIQRELQAMGIPFTAGIGGTGVVGVVGSGEKPVVALRADIDALPLEEESGVSFASEHQGRMHACGHDAHTTMLLGAGRMLKELEKSNKLGKGTIKLAFQPAEEGGAGALHIREHLQDVESIFGFHVWPNLPTGMVATRKGTIMASASFFKCFFKGKGTHGAMPHLGRDPVVAASAAIQALQTLISRTSSPFDSSVVSVTQFKAGEAFNVIPDETMIGGTMRALTAQSMRTLIDKARVILENIGEAYGCETVIDFMEDVHPITPPVVNSQGAYDKATRVAQLLLGKESVVLETEPSMAAEDFSYYTQENQIPEEAFVFLGIQNDTLGSNYPLHHPKFLVDEGVLPIGAAYHTALAMSSLEESLHKEL